MDFLLNNRELFDFGDDLRDCRIFCEAGCFWLTMAGDKRDHILHQGHSMTVNRKGKVLVMAMATTRIRLMTELVKS